MFENDTKGWYGSYSTAGRESAEKYHIVIHKKEILQNEHKKLKIRDLFTPDEPEEIQTLDDQFDIYKSYSSDKDNQKTQFLHSNNISKPKKKKKLKMINLHIIINILMMKKEKKNLLDQYQHHIFLDMNIFGLN